MSASIDARTHACESLEIRASSSASRLRGHIPFKTTSTRVARTWRCIKIHILVDAHFYLGHTSALCNNLNTHRHMRIGFKLWNVWNLIIQLHYESATGHLERPLAVRRGHGCEKGWRSLVPHFSKFSQARLHSLRHATFDNSELCFTNIKETDTWI